MHLHLIIVYFVSQQVIKKVMKMDAAEPFNAPVNPTALGIPVSTKCYIHRKCIHRP